MSEVDVAALAVFTGAAYIAVCWRWPIVLLVVLLVTASAIAAVLLAIPVYALIEWLVAR